MNIFNWTFKLILLFALLLSNNINAQDTTSSDTKKHFKNQYYITMGAYRPTVSTTLQVNGAKGPGVILSLEDNLGFSEHPWLYRADATANFTKRSGVTMTFVQLNRKQDWEADRDVTIFDTTFSAGAKLGIYFNTMFIAASYKYAVFSNPTWEAGLSVGIRFLQVKTGVNFESENFSDYAESVTVPAPVPVYGIFGSAFLTERLRTKYNFDYFTLEVSGIRGGVLDNRFALEYYFIKNLGLGANVSFLSYQIEEMPLAEDFDGKIKYSMNGFSFYLTAKF